MNSMQRPIMVMAGGTGGHVFPALAVAKYLRDQGERIVWMGTRAGIEARLVPAADFPIEWLTVQGLRGKGLWIKVLAPLKLAHACWQALGILRRNRPRAVLGMGGFAAGPGGLMAWLLRIPLVIHEQNAVMGMTNRWLSHLARVTCCAFPRAAEKIADAKVVGNPVRAEILALEHPRQRLSGRHEQVRLLVIGGSLGARTLNQVVPQALSHIDVAQQPQVRHQCGSRHLQSCQQDYADYQVRAEISEFIEDMPSAYAWADLVICRAGALTVAELAAVGVAAILVPYPYAVDDHQYLNAGYLADAGAALIVRDQQLDADWLAQTLIDLINDRDKLMQMACKARELSHSDATQLVAQAVLEEALI